MILQGSLKAYNHFFFCIEGGSHLTFRCKFGMASSLTIGHQVDYRPKLSLALTRWPAQAGHVMVFPPGHVGKRNVVESCKVLPSNTSGGIRPHCIGSSIVLNEPCSPTMLPPTRLIVAICYIESDEVSSQIRPILQHDKLNLSPKRVQHLGPDILWILPISKIPSNPSHYEKFFKNTPKMVSSKLWMSGTKREPYHHSLQ